MNTGEPGAHDAESDEPGTGGQTLPGSNSCEVLSRVKITETTREEGWWPGAGDREQTVVYGDRVSVQEGGKGPGDGWR